LANTVITGPILDSFGQPVDGYLYGAQTARSVIDGALVTQTIVKGRVIDGQLFLDDGVTPLEVPATAVDAEAFEWVEDFKPYKTQTVRYTTIPAAGPVAYAELQDVKKPAGSSTWIVPGWARELVEANAGMAASVAYVDGVKVTIAASAAAAEAAVGDAQEAGTNAAQAAVGPAVDAKLAGLQVPTYASFNPTAPETENLLETIDASSNRLWLEAGPTGGPSSYASDFIEREHPIRRTSGGASGYLVEVVDEADNLVWGSAANDGMAPENHIRLLMERGEKYRKGGTDVNLLDAIFEWHNSPMVLEDEDEDRTLIQSLGSAGQANVSQWQRGIGTRTVQVGTALVDDHNVGTPFLAGPHLCSMWSNHGIGPDATIINLIIGDTSIDSLARCPIIKIAGPGNMSYQQVHKIKHLSDATKTTFWVFTRQGNIGDFSWYVMVLTITHGTKAFTTSFIELTTGEGQQIYMSTADAHNVTGNQVIRCARFFNPNAASSHVHYFEIDVVTGAITSPIAGNSGLVANMSGTGLPLNNSAMVAAIPSAPAGFVNRVNYVTAGPYKPQILGAYMPDLNPEGGEQRRTVINADGTTTTTSYGSPGRSFSKDQDQWSYAGSMAAPDPCFDSTIAYAQNPSNGPATIKTARPGRAGEVIKTVVSDPSYMLIRPFWPKGGGALGLLYNRLPSYGSYTNFLSEAHSIQEF
jgi:hypothetical protein